MPQTIDSITAIEQLAEQLRALESRVSALESLPERKADFVASPPLQGPRPSPTRHPSLPLDSLSGTLTVVGKAVLGMAGAYLFRALFELGTIPKLPVLFVAILYACFWMIRAVRTHTSSRFASVTYAVTSALILSPLLWESTVRFQALSPALAAIVLVAFAVLTIALAWQRDLQLIPWVATLAAVVTSVALIIATRELVPLTAALLAVALATEVAACLGHRLSLRAIPALAADFAVWLLIYIMTSEVVPEGYRATTPLTLVTLCLSLLLIYGGSIGVRSFALRHKVTILEIAQGVVAFSLGSFGMVRATHNSAAPALGVLFLLLSAACYWGALSRFAADTHVRNRRVSANWAAALLLGGNFLLVPGSLQLLFLCIVAVAAALVYTRTSKLSLGLHASFYLAAAAAVSPLPAYAANALAGTVPSSPDWRLLIVAVSALVCYAIGSRHAEANAKRRLLWVVPAAIVGFSAATLVVVAVTGLATGRIELDASRLSVIRTVVNCGLALALAFLGSRWKYVELGWVAYAAVAFGTLKLLFEDLRFGNAASMVVSLLFYGLVLILLPRLTRSHPS